MSTGSELYDLLAKTNATLNPNNTITLRFNDGSSYTTGVIKDGPELSPADKAMEEAKEASVISQAAMGEANKAAIAAGNAEQSASEAAASATNAENFASEAQQSASTASTAATNAETSASNAATSAGNAATSAQAAATSADAAESEAQRAASEANEAKTSAGEAKTQANMATKYANGALNSLSTTQDIIGVLNWVEESIKYVWDYPPTVEDKEYDPSKQYYTVIGKRVIDPIETDYDKYYVLNSESEPASKTGNIVTFDSDLDNFPLKSLTATINPKQDLHGYDKPWVGGSGKNKFNPQPYTGIGYNANIGATVTLTEASATFENNTISYTIEAWYNRVFRTPKLAQGSYKISMTNIAITSPRVSVYEVSGTDNTIVGRSNYSELPTDWEPGFSITESGNYFVLVIGSNTAQTISFSYPQIEAGSIKTTYSPYANICPISGWDEVNTYAYGANMCPTTPFERGQYVNNAWNSETDRITTDFIPIKPNTDYYMQIDIPEVKSLCFINYNYFDANKTWLGNRTTNGDVSINGLKQYTVNISNTNTAYLRVTIRRQDNMDMSSLTLADANLFLSVGNTITTTLPQTVYGGTLDVVSGVLTVDRAMVDLGTLNWAYNASWGGYPAFYVTTAPDNILPVYVTSKYPQNYICQGYEGYTRDYLNAHDITGFCIPPDGKISIRDSRYTDAATFKTAMSGVMLVYELATPTTIQCDPQTVQTLIGDNNVWADSGDVTVEYWDGPVGYVTPTSSFDPTETYYTVKGSPVKIDESKQEEHSKGLYYVHDLTNAKEAMADFIKARLALTDKGLYVVGGDTENEGYKILLASDGMTVYDAQGVAVSKFGESIEFSATRAQYIGNEDAFIVFNPTTAEITIGGDVLIDGTKRLSDVLTDLDVSVTQTATGADITVNGDTVSIANGQAGEDGSTIWTTTTAPTTPNYTFTISHLSGATGLTPKIGDVIIYSYYRYQITSVTDTTVRSTTCVSIRGAAGTAGKWYTGTGITGTSTTETIYSDSGVASAVVGDMYLNTDTNNTYRCTKAGAPTVAKWVFADNIQGEQGPQGIQGVQGPQGDTGPEAIVTVSVTAINYIAKTATLSATLRVDGVVTTPTSYKWTKGTSTTSLGTGATLNVTDLNAVYNCTATW